MLSQVGVPALGSNPSSTFQQIEIDIPDLETQKKVVKLYRLFADEDKNKC